MDPKQNSGSFGAAAGGGSAVAQAIQNRMPGGVLNQVTPASPTFGSTAQPVSVPANAPQGLPQPAPQGQPQPAPAPGAPAGGQGLGTPEAQIIISALSTRLKSISKQEEGSAQLNTPAPAPIPGQ